MSAELRKQVEVELEQLGRELGKEAVFEPVVKLTALPFLKELKNPIIHLLRNSMDHGLEDIYERTASGKPSASRCTRI